MNPYSESLWARCGCKAGGLPELPFLGPLSLRPLWPHSVTHLQSSGHCLQGSVFNLSLDTDTFFSCTVEAAKPAACRCTQSEEGQATTGCWRRRASREDWYEGRWGFLFPNWLHRRVRRCQEDARSKASTSTASSTCGRHQAQAWTHSSLTSIPRLLRFPGAEGLRRAHYNGYWWDQVISVRLETLALR